MTCTSTPCSGCDSCCGVDTGTVTLPTDPNLNDSQVVTVTPGYGGLWVSWTWPSTNPHAVAFVKIYRGTTSNSANALYLTRVQSDLHFDRSEVVANTTYYYWIRFISINGTEGNLLGPGSGTMKPTVDDVLDGLAGMIRDTQLYQDLQSEITSIASLDGELATERLDRIAGDLIGTTAWATLQNDLNAVDTALIAETTARTSGDTALVTQVNAIYTQSNANQVLIGNEVIARTDADTALGQRTDFITASVGIEDDPNDPNYGGYVVGSAVDEVKVNLGYDAATGTYSVNATNISELNVDMNGSNGIVQQTMAIVGLENAAGGGTQATNPPTGLGAQWMVKTSIPSGGGTRRIAGFGLYNDGVTSDFIVQATKFAIIDDTLTTGAGVPNIPFVVYNRGNGDAVIGMDASVFIKEASIETAQIKDLAVNEAKIFDGSITNAKIGDGIQDSTFAYNAGVSAAGWRISKQYGIQATAITITNTAGETILSSGGTVWDYVTGNDRPADNAQVNHIAAQIKINYVSFTAANTGEIYLHGFNDDGTAADVDGFLFGIDSTGKTNIGKGSIFTGAKTGWFMYASSGLTFSHGGSFNKGAVVKKEGTQWQYDLNGTWTNFTPNDTCWIIGSVTGTGSDSGLGAGNDITAGALFATPIHFSRVNGFGELDRIDAGNASTYIANLAVDTLQIAGGAVTVSDSVTTTNTSCEVGLTSDPNIGAGQKFIFHVNALVSDNGTNASTYDMKITTTINNGSATSNTYWFYAYGPDSWTVVRAATGNSQVIKCKVECFAHNTTTPVNQAWTQINVHGGKR